MMKTKTIKEKVAAKIAKGKAKIAKKCGKAKTACEIAVLLALVSGCQAVPSRSQTLNVENCTITVYGGQKTNTCASIEFATQAMSIENSGTESLNPTQTTDTKPDVDVTVGGVGGGTAAEVAKSVTAGANAVSAIANACADGSCNVSGTTNECSDGSCTLK